VTTSGPGSSIPVFIPSHPQLGGKTILVPNNVSKFRPDDSESEELTDPDADAAESGGQDEDEEVEESDAEGVTDDEDAGSDVSMKDPVKRNGYGSGSKRGHARVDSEENDLDDQMWGLRRSVS
jgi:hypothetical protein